MRDIDQFGDWRMIANETIESEKKIALELYRALGLVSTIPTFKMEVDPTDGRFTFTLGHRPIGYDDSWLPVKYFASLDELTERLTDAYSDYMYCKQIRASIDD